jgi:hypothetical protein
MYTINSDYDDIRLDRNSKSTTSLMDTVAANKENNSTKASTTASFKLNGCNSSGATQDPVTQQSTMPSIICTPDRSKTYKNGYPVIESPVPLYPEEQASAEVRALAAKLAPVLIESDRMLALEFFSSNDNNNSHTAKGLYGMSYNEDEDDMDDEMNHLERAEVLLRQEMDVAFQQNIFCINDDLSSTRQDNRVISCAAEDNSNKKI